MQLGEIGIWRRRQHGADALAELEALGFTALWVGSSPSPADARPFLERSSTMTIATGILNVWQHDPADVAEQHAGLTREFPGRFLLGIGIGHPEATAEYTSPLARMRAFFDGLDAAAQPVPRDERAAAALGPKMLELAAQRSLGAHTYFVTPEHTRFAREQAGPDALVAPELAVVVETDADAARRPPASTRRSTSACATTPRTSCASASPKRDIADGGSDRLIDAVIPHGSAEQIAEVVRAHREAGADHVALQPLGHGPVPVADYEAIWPARCSERPQWPRDPLPWGPWPPSTRPSTARDCAS